MGELWDVYCEYFGENWPHYNGTELYSSTVVCVGVTYITINYLGDICTHISLYIDACPQPLVSDLWVCADSLGPAWVQGSHIMSLFSYFVSCLIIMCEIYTLLEFLLWSYTEIFFAVFCFAILVVWLIYFGYNWNIICIRCFLLFTYKEVCHMILYVFSPEED